VTRDRRVRPIRCSQLGRASFRHLLRTGKPWFTQLGGRVESGHKREFGRAEIEVSGHSPLLEGVWPLGSRDTVLDEPWRPGDPIAAGLPCARASENAPFAVIADETRHFYGVMFHPEVVHTPKGGALLRNFTQMVAGIAPDWNMKAFRADAVRRIREQVGKGRVICGTFRRRGSSVAALLIHEAVGDSADLHLCRHRINAD